MQMNLVLAILLILSIAVYYIAKKLHKKDESLVNHETLRIMTTVVFGIYIFFLMSELKSFHHKTCRSILFLFMLLIAGQMVVILLREFGIIQIDHSNMVILNNTLGYSVLIEFLLVVICKFKIFIYITKS